MNRPSTPRVQRQTPRETAREQSRRRGSGPRHALRPLHAAALAACGFAPAVLALPQGAQPSFGQTQVQTPAAGQMTITQATARAGIDWTSFSIAAGERVNIVQPGANSVLLNRVLGDNPSQIYGSLTANGGVWLINPRGIVFGRDSRVDVGSLVASTLAISNDDVQSGRLLLGRGAGGAGGIRADGAISAHGGTVVLAAPQLVVGGQIEAARVGLVAATEVLVDVEGDGLIFFNARNDGSLDAKLSVLGQVRADGGLAEVRAAARAGFAGSVLNMDGIVQARGLGQREGKVVIDGGTSGIASLAGTVDVSNASGKGGDARVLGEKILLDKTATIDASGRDGGGEVRIGGDWQGKAAADIHNAEQLIVRSGAEVRADAGERGDGGLIVLWSEKATRFYGHVSGRGGAHGGDGGKAEVSGKEWLDFQGTADLSAPFGQLGLLLLDPTDIFIVNTGGSVLGGDVNFGDANLEPGNSRSRFTATSLEALLGGNDVVLQATRDITFTDPVSTAAANALTIQAGRDVIVNASITTGGAISLTSNAQGNNAATGEVTVGAAITAGAGLTIDNNSGASTHVIGADLTATSLTLAGNANLSANSTWTLSGASTITTAIGEQGGTRTLIKAGAGLLTVDGGAAGAINTGLLTVNAGGLTLASGSTTRLGNATALTVAATNTLTLNAASETILSLDLGGTVAGSGALTATTFTATGATARIDGSATVGTTNSSVAAAATLTLASSAATPLTSTNATTVGAGGNLAIGRAGAMNLGSVTGASGSVTLSDNAADVTLTGKVDVGTLALSGTGATLRLANDNGDRLGASALTVGSGRFLVLGNTAETIGTLSLGGTLSGNTTLNVTGATLTGGTVASGTTLSAGAGTFTASSGNTQIAGVLDTSGTLEIAANATLTTAATADRLSNAPNVTLAGQAANVGTLAIGGNETIGSLASVAAGDGALTLGANTLTVRAKGNSTTTFSGTSTGTGGITVDRISGTGTFTIDSTQAYTGTTRVQAGTLILGANAVLASTTTQVDSGALLDLAGAASLEALTLNGTLGSVDATARTLTVTSASLAGATVDAEATIGAGAGAIDVGAGTTTLNGVLSTTGTLTIAGGTLNTAATTGRLAGAPALVVQGTGVLGVGAAESATSLSLAGTGGTATGTGPLSLSGNFSSAGASNLRTTLRVTGTAAVTGGTLTVGNNDANGRIADAAGATDIAAIDVAAGATVDFNRTAFALASNITGTGTLRRSGSGVMTFNGVAQSVTGTDVSGGTLTLGDSGAAVDRIAGNVTVGGGGSLVTGNQTETVTSLTLAGGNVGGASNLILTGAFSSSGSSNLARQVEVGTTSAVTGGTLTFSGTGALRQPGDLLDVTTIALSGTPTLVIDRAMTLASDITGAGTLRKSGAGVATVTGAAANLTALDVTGGTLNLGTTLPAVTAVTVTAGAADVTLALANGSSDRLGAGANVTLTGSATNQATLNTGNQAEEVASLTTIGNAGGTTLGGTAGLTTTGNMATNGGGQNQVGILLTVNGGVTVVAGSTLFFDSANLLGGNPATLVDGSLSLGGALGIGGLSGGGTLALAGNTLTITPGAASSFTGGSSGTGNLTIAASNTNTQSFGANLGHTGSTTVSTGTVLLTSDVATLGSDVTVNDGATLRFTGDKSIGSKTLTLDGALEATAAATFTATAYSFTGGSTDANAGLGAGTLTATSGSSTLASASGTTAVNVNAGATLVLATGADIVNAGSTVTVANTGTLTVNTAETIATLALSGTLGGTNTVTATTSTFTGGSTAVGTTLTTGTLNANSGTNTLNGTTNATTVQIADDAALVLAGTTSLTNTATVTVAADAGGPAGGGTLTVSANNTIGTLNLSGTLNGAATLTASTAHNLLNGASVGAVLSGPIVVNPGLGNTVTLGTAPTATSSLNVTSGTLALGTNVTVVDATVAAGLSGSFTLDATNSMTLAGATVATGTVLGGTSALTVNGGATSTLNGTSAATTVNLSGATGTQLALATASRLTGNPNVTVNANNTLNLVAGTNNVNGLSLAGAVTGGGTLDTATVTATGANALIAATVNATTTITVAGGNTLTLGDGAASGTLGGAGALTVNGTLAFNPAGSVIFDKAIAGTGTLAKSGSNQLTLDANADALTAVNVSGGTLVLGANSDLGTGAAIGVTNGATLTLGKATETVTSLALNGTLNGGGNILVTTGGVTTSGTTAVNAVLGGTDTLTVSGGTTTLSQKSNQGTVNVSGGNLTLAASTDLLNDGGTVNVTNARTLTINGNESIGTLNIQGSGTDPSLLNNSAAGQTLTATAYNLQGRTTINADLGAGTLTASGTVVNNLVGTANVAPLTVTINSGATLRTNSPTTLSNSASVVNNGTWNRNYPAGNPKEEIGSFSGSGNGTGSGQYRVLGTTVWTDGDVIDDDAETNNLTSSGNVSVTDDIVISGTATFGSGTVTISGGGSLDLGAATVLNTGALLRYNVSTASSAAGTITGTGTLATAGSGGLTLSGTFNQGSATVGTISVEGGTFTFGAGLANRLGSGTLVNVTNGATLTTGASGDNAQQLATLNLAGTLAGTSAVTAATTNITGTSSITGLLSTPTLNLTTGNLTLGGGRLVVPSDIDIPAGRTLTVDGAEGAGITTLAGTIAGGGTLTTATLNATGTAALITTTVNTTTTSIDNAGNNAVLTIGSGGASGTLLGAITIDNGSVLSFNRSGSVDAPQVLGGTGTIRHAGTGTMNVGVGGIVIAPAEIEVNNSAATVQLANANTNSVGDSTTVRVTSGTFSLSDRSETVGALIASANVAGSGGTLTAASYTLNTGADVTAPLGAGTLTVAGNSTLRSASGAGIVNIDAGRLTLGTGGSLSNAADVTIGTGVPATGATLRLSNGNQSVASLRVREGTLEAAAAQVLTASTPTNSYRLEAGSVIASPLGSGAILVTGNTQLNADSAASVLNISAGTLTANAANRFTTSGLQISVDGATANYAMTGGQNIGTGLIQFFNGGRLSGTGTLQANLYRLGGGTVESTVALGTGTLEVTQGSNTLAGTAAVGTLNIGGGSLALVGASRFSGTPATTMTNAPTLTLGGNEQIGAFEGNGTVNLGIGNVLTVVAPGSNIFAGTLTGNSTLRKQGGGLLELRPGQNHGETEVLSGTLRLFGNNVLPDTANVTVADGARLELAGNDTIGGLAVIGSGRVVGNGVLAASGIALSGGGTLLQRAIVDTNVDLRTTGTATTGGFVELAGTLGATSGLDVQSGTLGTTGAERIVDATGLTVSGGATLNLGSTETVATATVAGSVVGAGPLVSSGAMTLNSGASIAVPVQAASVGVSGPASVAAAMNTPTIDVAGGGNLSLTGTNQFSDITAALTVASGGTLTLSLGGAAHSVATSNVSGSLDGPIAPASATLTATASHTLAGGAAVGSQVVLAGPTTNVSGSGNTLSGRVATGTLNLLANAALTVNAAGPVSDTIGDTTPVSMAGGSTLTLPNAAETIATLTMNGSTLVTGGPSSVLNLANNANLFALDGATVNAVLGNGSLRVSGGTSNLNTATSTAVTNVEVQAGAQLNLNGANRLTSLANVVVGSGATLAANDNQTVASLTLNGSTLSAIPSNGTFTAANVTADGATIAANIAGTGGQFTVNGGTTTLSGTAGHATVQVNGRLDLASAGRFGAAFLTVDNGGRLNLAGNELVDRTFIGGTTGGTLGGSGTLTVLNQHLLRAGAVVEPNLVLAGPVLTVNDSATLQGTASTAVVSVTGTTTVFTLDGASRLTAAAPSLDVGSTSTVAFGGAQTLGSLTGTGALNLGTHTLTVGASDVSSTFNGSTAATAGNLTKVGTGTLTLGGALAHTGTTTVAAGTLATTGANRLSAGSLLVVPTGSTVALGGVNTTNTVSRLELGGTLSGAGNTLQGSQPNGSINYALTNGALVQANLGTGALTATGGNGGEMRIVGSVAAADQPISVDVLSGTLRLQGPDNQLSQQASVRVVAGATLQTDNNHRVAAFELAGTPQGPGQIFSDVFVLGTGGAAVNVTAPILRITGNSTLSGQANVGTIQVNGGTLTLTNPAGGQIVGAPLVVFDSSPADVGLALGGNEVFGSLGGGNAGDTLNLGGALLTTGGGGSTTFGGAITGTGGRLTKTGNSLFVLAGTNTYTGATTVAGGTLALSATGTLVSSPIVVQPQAVLELQASDRLADAVTVQVLRDATGPGVLRLRHVDNSTPVNDTIATFTTAGLLEGIGTLTAGTTTLQDGAAIAANLGDGILESSGATSLGGTSAATVLNVSGGVMTLGSAGRLTAAPTTTLSGDARLQLAGNETLGSLSGVAGTSVGLANNGTLTTGSASNTTFAGQLTGSGALIKQGSGIFTLGSGSNDYTGSTSVAAGTLATDGDERIPNGSALSLAAGTTLTLGGNETVASLTSAGTHDGGANRTLTAATYALNGATVGTALGGGIVTSDGTTALGSGVAATSVTVNTGSLTLGQASALSAVPTVALVGTASMNLAGSETIANLAGAAGTTLALAGNGTLTTGNATDTTMAGRITGAGSLVKQGSGQFTLGSTANDWTGSTTVNVGTLATDGTNRLPDGTALTVASNAFARIGGDDTIASALIRGFLTGPDNRLTAATVTLDSGVVQANLGPGTLASSGSSTLSGIAGSTVLNVTGGTLTLDQAGRLTAAPATTLSGGARLQLAGNETLRSLAGVAGTSLGLANNGTLTTGNATNTSFAGQIGGTGNLRKVGSGSFTLGSDTNNWVGSTTVAAGTLATDGTNRLPDNTALTVDSGATTTLGGDDTVATATIAGTLGGAAKLTASTITLAAGTANANLGAGALVSNGASLLAGTADSNSLRIDNGTLTLGSGGRFTALPATTVEAGATLAMAGNETLGALSGAGTLAAGSASLTTQSSTDSSFAGAVSGDASSRFVKRGSSTLALTGNHSLSGTVRVEEGTLAVAGTLAAAQVTVDGSTARLRLDADERLENAATLSVQGGSRLETDRLETVATLNVANATLAGNGRIVATTTNLADANVDLALGGGLLRSTGATQLSRTSDASQVQVDSGTLSLASAGRLTATPAVTVAGGATLALGGNETAGTLAGAGTVNLGSGILSTGSGGDSLFSGVLAGTGGLTKLGSSTFTLSGGNTYTGPTTVGGGTLALSGTLASGNVQIQAGELALATAERLADGSTLGAAAGATIRLNGDETIDRLQLSGTLTGTGRVQAGNGYTLAGGRVDANAALGTGTLASSGDSTLAGTAAAANVGVDSGTLTLASAERLTGAPTTTVAAGATLRFGGNQTLGRLGGGGAVDLASFTLTTGNAGDSTFNGVIGGTGGLVKLGNSTFGIGAGQTYTGSTVVQAGTLATTAADALADPTAVSVASGATLRLGGNDTVASLVLSGIGEGPGTLTAATYDLSGGTAVGNLGAGTLRSTGASRLDGSSAAGTVQVNGGQLTLGSADRLADTATLTVASGARLSLNGNDRVATTTLAGTLDGSGTLTSATTALDGGVVQANLGNGSLVSDGASRLEGTAASDTLTIASGTLTAASANRFTAAPTTSIAGGASLSMTGDQTLGALSGSGTVALGSFTLTAGAANDASFAGVLQGSGGLSKAGAGTQTLTGDNTYTGLTRVLAGTLRVGDGGTNGRIASTSGFELAGTLAYARSDTVALSQPISGSGGLVQAGSGTIQVSGNNKSYSGSTQVQSGTLATTGTQELPDLSQVQVANGAALVLGGTETLGGIDADGTVGLAGSLTAGGDLLMRGAVTVAGNAAIALDAARIEAPNLGNNWGTGALAIAARGPLNLVSGRDGNNDRNLTLGTVRVAQGGSISGGALALAQGLTVEGGSLSLNASAAKTLLTGDAAVDTFLATRRTPNNLPAGFASDVVTQAAGSTITVATGSSLKVVVPSGGSVALTSDTNNIDGWISVISGGSASAPTRNWTIAGPGSARDVQGRIRLNGVKITVGTDLPLVANFPGQPGLIADTISIRADQLATTPGGAGAAPALIFARLPFDNAAGTDAAIPGLTLELRQPNAFANAGSFGSNTARILTSVGDSGFPIRAGLTTVLPRPVVAGQTTVQLAGPDFTGGYVFFIEGNGRPNTVPVFYNGLSPSSPQVNNTLGATVAVSEGARRERFEESVRTENVATRLRSGVIAEVGAGSPATVGVGGAAPPSICTPTSSDLGCQASDSERNPTSTSSRVRTGVIREVGAGAGATSGTGGTAPPPACPPGATGLGCEGARK
jgi:filamentous hemagglutinin family protein